MLPSFNMAEMVPFFFKNCYNKSGEVIMKNKYQRMSKEEKKELQNKFKQSAYGQNLLFRLKRLLIIGIVGICFSLLEFGVAFFNKKDIWDLISGSILFIISLIFIIGSIRTKSKKLNEFALKQK